jgi:predicted transcriptional regulator
MSRGWGGPNRARILEHVEQNPGIQKIEVCRALGLSWGTVTYHLQLLSRQGAVATRCANRQVRLYPPGAPERFMPYFAALRTPASAAILSALRDQPGIRMNDLSQNLALSRRIVQGHLNNLAQAGLVQREGQRNIRFSLADAALEPGGGKQP